MEGLLNQNNSTRKAARCKVTKKKEVLKKNLKK